MKIMKSIYCIECHTKNTYESPGFRATCEQCSHDLHICKNCSFYDENAYNECRESSADRVADKERNNTCEYFKALQTPQTSEKKEDLLKQAEALFKKK